jgi:hypothetical protein
VRKKSDKPPLLLCICQPLTLPMPRFLEIPVSMPAKEEILEYEITRSVPRTFYKKDYFHCVWKSSTEYLPAFGDEQDPGGGGQMSGK